MTRWWAARRRKRLLGRLLVPVALLGVACAVLYLAVSARAIVPWLSGVVHPIHYAEIIARVADSYDVSPYLIAAVARAESSYNPEAVSHAGAMGLMQIMPRTAEWVTNLDRWKGPEDPDLFNPAHSLELGACYLAYLTDRFHGDRRVAIAAYNAGQGTVTEWLESSGGASGLDLADIRFQETREFVKRVERYYNLYKRIHPRIFEPNPETA